MSQKKNVIRKKENSYVKCNEGKHQKNSALKGKSQDGLNDLVSQYAKNQVNTQTKRKGSVALVLVFRQPSIVYFIYLFILLCETNQKKLTQMLDPLFHWWLFIYLMINFERK